MEFDDKFLQEMGLSAMPEQEKQAFLDYVKEHQHSSRSSFEKTRLRILPKQESPIGHAYDQASATILS